MFKMGDWVYAVSLNKIYYYHALIIGETKDYYLCYEQQEYEQQKMNFDEIIEKYFKNKEIILQVCKKEYVFATEEEARKI